MHHQQGQPWQAISLRRPEVLYFFKPGEWADNYVIRFVVSVSDTSETKHDAAELCYSLKHESWHHSRKTVISAPFEPNTFDTGVLHGMLPGTYEVVVQTLVTFYCNGAEHRCFSPTVTFTMMIPQQCPNQWNSLSGLKTMFAVDDQELEMQFYKQQRQHFHQKQWAKYIVQTTTDSNDETSSEQGGLQLVELDAHSADHELVASEFLRRAQMNASKVEMFVYRIRCPLRESAYQHKCAEILTLLDGDASKLNEFALFHGTCSDTLFKTLHAGFVRYPNPKPKKSK